MIARTVAQLWLSSCEIVKISLHVQVEHWRDTTSEVTKSSLRVTSPLSNLQGNPTETHLTSNLPGWPLVWWSSPLPVLTMRHGDLGALRSLSLSYSWHILFSSATLVSMDKGITSNSLHIWSLQSCPSPVSFPYGKYLMMQSFLELEVFQNLDYIHSSAFTPRTELSPLSNTLFALKIQQFSCIPSMCSKISVLPPHLFFSSFA